MIKDQVDVYSGSRIRFFGQGCKKKTFRIFGNVQKFGKSFSLAPPCRWRSYSSTGNVASASSATRHVYNPVTRHAIKHVSSSVTSPAIKYVSRHAIRHASSP